MIMAQPSLLESCLLNCLQNGVVVAFQQLSTEMARCY
jgi:hypothetical protein